MILRRLVPLVLLAAALLFAQKQKAQTQKAQKQKSVKPGFNLFSLEQDIQLGQESAAQVEREMQLVNDPNLTALIDRIGKKLMAANAADQKNAQFPFTFKVVNEPSINAFALPDDWLSQLAQDQVSLTLAAADGLLKGANGQNDVAHGVLISIIKTQSQNLNTETQALLKGLLQGNSGLRQTGNPQPTQVNGAPALLTAFEGQSSMRQGEKEIIRVLTLIRPQGLFNAVFVAPDSRWRIADPEYQEMIRSLRF